MFKIVRIVLNLRFLQLLSNAVLIRGNEEPIPRTCCNIRANNQILAKGGFLAGMLVSESRVRHYFRHLFPILNKKRPGQF
jgi:hypothetical protein